MKRKFVVLLLSSMFLGGSVTPLARSRQMSEPKESAYASALSEFVTSFEDRLPARQKVAQSLTQAKVNALVEKMLEKYDMERELCGIAFETLDGRLRYQLNGDEDFVAASLYKVPLALLYYDALNAGDLDADTALYYGEDMYEDGGVIASCYGFGDEVPLTDLLDNVITNSDNTAGHILFENLGGWGAFKESIAVYGPDHATSEAFYGSDNYLSPNYMNDVMRRIASSPGQYRTLCENMRDSQPENYLNLNLSRPIPQKYGALEAEVNASGFNLDVTVPYVVTIMTAQGGGEAFIGELSAELAALADGRA